MAGGIVVILLVLVAILAQPIESAASASTRTPSTRT